MPYDLSSYLVVGISSRALFSLEEENGIFEKQGVGAYSEYQLQNEDVPMKKGVAFPLIKSLLALNEKECGKKVEVVLMSRNSPDTSLRIFNSCKHYKLDIESASLTSGQSLAPYFKAFKVDLFLSANAEDVAKAVDFGIAGALVCNTETEFDDNDGQIRIAFDGDAVLFSDEAEKIFQSEGLDAFLKHERENAKRPLPKGPFAKLLRTISDIQKAYEDVSPDKSPIRTALVTARNSPAETRVLLTLREWGVRVDEAYFLGGVDKTEVLKAFKPHMFFDDQEAHTLRAQNFVPSAKVPTPKSLPSP